MVNPLTLCFYYFIFKCLDVHFRCTDVLTDVLMILIPFNLGSTLMPGLTF